jgi:hypothetical protein
MAIPEEEKLTVDEFLEAITGRDGRFELVRSVAYAMAGAKEGHDVICSNVQTALVPAGKRLRSVPDSGQILVKVYAGKTPPYESTFHLGGLDPIRRKTAAPDRRVY